MKAPGPAKASGATRCAALQKFGTRFVGFDLCEFDDGCEAAVRNERLRGMSCRISLA
jgi:hypothetical protein